MNHKVNAWKPAAPTPQLASARLRCFRPMKYLNAAGIQCELFDPNRMDRYRTVVFQKAYSDHDLDIAAHLHGLGVRTVFDLCDNHFVGPPERAVRLRQMIERVDAVTVATPELATWIGRPCEVIDDALDEVPARRWLRFPLVWPRRSLRLVWFGNAGQDDPPFGLIDLARIRPHLEQLHRIRPIRLTVVSNSRPTFDRHMAGIRFPATYVEWDNRRYQSILRRQDLCLIPVTPNPFTNCKTSNRLALSLLLGLPAAVDLIPSYEELKSFVHSGDWSEGLIRYCENRQLQQRQVRSGQEYLRQKYSAERVVAQWSYVIRRAA
jgi:hypothetical protein